MVFLIKWIRIVFLALTLEIERGWLKMWLDLITYRKGKERCFSNQ